MFRLAIAVVSANASEPPFLLVQQCFDQSLRAFDLLQALPEFRMEFGALASAVGQPFPERRSDVRKLLHCQTIIPKSA
jgi:hypothetical protein